MSTARTLRIVLSAALTSALVAVPASCVVASGPVPAPTPSSTENGTTSPSPRQSAQASPETRPRDVELTLLAAGDVLPHGPVNDSASGPAGIDYSPLLSGIDPWVARADLALCHLESPVAPRGTPPSGYPVFAAPRELVQDLDEQGWDGCSTASNHAADAGYAGIAATLRALDRAGMGHVGTARDRHESRGAQHYELRRDGRTVTVAHLAATYDLNGYTAPGGDWSIDLIDTGRIVRQAETARAEGADLVVVSLHDGHEYVTEPTRHQRETTRALARSGQVDLVIGHHAHVPQPIEQLRGGPGGEGMWVAYGLGNLISNQGLDCCGTWASAVGLLLVADVVSPPRGAARVEEVRWAATTVDLAAGHRLRGTRDALAHPGRGQLTVPELRERLRLARDGAGTTAVEQRRPPEPGGGPPPRVLPRTQ